MQFKVYTMIKAKLQQAISSYSSTSTDTMCSPRPKLLLTSRPPAQLSSNWNPEIWVDTDRYIRGIITYVTKIKVQQVRWLAQNDFFSSFHLFCLTRAWTNEPAASISTRRDWCSRFATRFSTKKVESMSQTRTNLSKTWSQTRFLTRFGAVVLCVSGSWRTFAQV